MSLEVMSAVWKHSKAEGRARLVLLAIADHQGEIGAWPSIATLAKMVNASERSVKRDLRELELLGELEIHLQAAPSAGQYKSNLYWVKLDALKQDKSGVTEWVSEVIDSASGVTDGANRGDSGWHTNPIEPLLKPLTKTAKTATEINDDYLPSAELIIWAKEKTPWVDVMLETETFIRYWQSTANPNKKLDWDKTWQNWMAKAQTYAKQPPTEAPKTKALGDW